MGWRIVWLCMIVCFGASVFAGTDTLTGSDFDTTVATKWLDEFETKFDPNEARPTHLKEAINTLEDWQKEAKRCVDLADAALNSIQQAAAATSATPVPVVPTPSLTLEAAEAAAAKAPELTKEAGTAEKAYLETKIASIKENKSKCKVIVLRTQEMMDRYRRNLDELARLELLSGGPHVWFDKWNFSELTQLPTLLLGTRIVWSQFLGLNFLPGWAKSLFLILPLIGFGFGSFMRWRIRTRLAPKPAETASGKMWQAFLAVSAHYVIPFFTLMGVLSVLGIVWVIQADVLPFILFILTLIAFLLLAAAADFIFYPPAPAVQFNKVIPKFGKRIRRNIRWLGLWLVIAANLYVIHGEFLLNFTTLFTVSCVTLIVISVNLSLLVHHVRTLWEHQATLKGVHRFLSRVVQVALMLVVAASCLAYHHLAFYLMRGIILTLGAAAVFWLGLSLLHAIFPHVGEAKPNWQRQLRQKFGVPTDEEMIEFTVIKFAFYFVYVFSGFIVLASIWGVSGTVRIALRESVWQGFSIGSISIIPVRIVIGLVFFSLFMFVTRMVSHLILKEATYLERGAREAYSAMVNYLGWGIGLLVTLTLAGVNLAGLAIVAGALSVGIGFGLQNIVNNFVSGIILLIERPIKVGDRIVVGDSDGIVKKISIRSTQIKTGAQSDIIVPNSDLITRHVTNFMFRDQRGRLTAVIFMPYGVSVELVLSTILKVLNDHPDVLKKEADEPVVQLVRLGESNIRFEAYFTIRDISQKGRILSEVYINIEHALRHVGLPLIQTVFSPVEAGK